jgi:hypothetical protein
VQLGRSDEINLSEASQRENIDISMRLVILGRIAGCSLERIPQGDFTLRVLRQESHPVVFAVGGQIEADRAVILRRIGQFL